MFGENAPSTVNDEEIRILDMVLVLVQNLRLLIVTPILAGSLGIGLTFFVTPEFESKAVQLGNPTLLAIYNVDELRDVVIKTVNFAKLDEDADTARKRLGMDLSATFNSKDKTLTVTGRAATAESAQKLVRAAVESAGIFNKPQLAQIELLKQQIQLGIAREQEASKAAAKISQQLLASQANNQAALAQAQAQLLDAARGAQATTASLSDQLSRLQTFEVIQSPSLSTRKAWPSKAKFAIALSAGAFFLALLFVFTRFTIQIVYRRNSELKGALVQIGRAWRRSIGLNKSV